jgi:hypothetical protein
MLNQTSIEAPSQEQPVRRSVRGLLLVALLAFGLGAAVVTWLEWRGYLDWIVPTASDDATEASAQLTESQTAAEPTAPAKKQAEAQPAPRPAEAEQLKAVGTFEGRLAMLEDRLSRLDIQASAASGNAARAEGLLIAFATRRMVDRGEPLRYLSDQLKLRFADAQPRAVQTIIAFSQNPVTIDELAARLEALEPQLAKGSRQESLWTTLTGEISELFALRRDSSDVLTPSARIERAKVMLTAGRIPEAVEQVELLPGAQVAEKWIADARRFAEAQNALDLIETAAMLEPRKLKDSEGKQIDQPSPLATPVGPATEGEKK